MFQTKKKGRNKTPGTEVILYLNLAKDSSHTAFTLEYVNNIEPGPPDPITEARTLEAGIATAEAEAELFKIEPVLKKNGQPGPKIAKTLLGTYSVPFKVTVTP